MVDGKRTLLVLVGATAIALLCAVSNVYSDDSQKHITGKQVFEQKCLKCHKPEKFTTQHHDRREWEQILSRMELNTCVLSDAEANAVADYLVKEHGD
jgi:mono/diheme cytochrome c family protein